MWAIILNGTQIANVKNQPACDNFLKAYKDYSGSYELIFINISTGETIIESEGVGA